MDELSEIYKKFSSPEGSGDKGTAHSYIENYYNKDNEIIVKTIIVDCDDKPDLADKYEVKGYPTIKLIYKGDVYDYDAKPELNSLKQFLNTTI